MAVGPFLSDDTGFSTLLSSENWETSDIYLALVTTTYNPTRGSQTWSDISANADADRIALSTLNPAVGLNGTNVRFTHTKATFTEDGSKTGRYVFYLFGTAGDPQAADAVIGYIDLTGDGDAESTNAEFSFTPDATNGLFQVARTSAP